MLLFKWQLLHLYVTNVTLSVAIAAIYVTNMTLSVAIAALYVTNVTLSVANATFCDQSWVISGKCC